MPEYISLTKISSRCPNVGAFKFCSGRGLWKAKVLLGHGSNSIDCEAR